jgi:hypothetical protein
MYQEKHVMRATRTLFWLASTLALTGCVNSPEHAEFLMQTAWTDHTTTAHKALHTPQNCYCYKVLGGVECYPKQQPSMKGRLLTDPIVLLKAKKENKTTEKSAEKEDSQKKEEKSDTEQEEKAENADKEHEEGSDNEKDVDDTLAEAATTPSQTVDPSAPKEV